MPHKSRAEYFRKRRETKGQFMAMIDKETLERLNNWLGESGKTKTAWLTEKIREELGDE